MTFPGGASYNVPRDRTDYLGRRVTDFERRVRELEASVAGSLSAVISVIVNVISPVHLYIQPGSPADAGQWLWLDSDSGIVAWNDAAAAAAGMVRNLFIQAGAPAVGGAWLWLRTGDGELLWNDDLTSVGVNSGITGPNLYIQPAVPNATGTWLWLRTTDSVLLWNDGL